MNWSNKTKRVYQIIALLAVVFSACEPTPDAMPEKKKALQHPAPVYHSLKHLVSIDSLWQMQADSVPFRLVDVRKAASYLEGHIAGALCISRSDFGDHTNFPYKGMAAQREVIADLLGSLGIRPNDHLICYDAKGGSDAARFWFVLKCYGHPNISLLDGGLIGWKKAGFPVAQKPVKVKPSSYAFATEGAPEMFIRKEEILPLMNDTNVIFVDTRTRDEYTGERLKSGATKAGRLPNSILWEWGNAVSLDSDACFKSAKDLAYEFSSSGIRPEKQIVVYCHTGTRSSHTWFVLSELMGFRNVRNYDGSWSEWSYFEDLPFETDLE